MKVPKAESQFEILAASNYMARLYQIIYVGTVPVEWQGAEKWQFKVRFTFEFPTELKVFNEDNGEQPYVLSREYTLSMNSKGNLRPMIESWLGKKMTDNEAVDFDIDELLGKEAMVNVVHMEKDGNTYANISTISPLMKGSKCPPAINPPMIFGYENWDQSFFDTLPEFIQKKIMSSKQYEAMMGNAPQAVVGPTEPIKTDKDADKEIKIADIPF